LVQTWRASMKYRAINMQKNQKYDRAAIVNCR
jgi:hypothetical protein